MFLPLLKRTEKTSRARNFDQINLQLERIHEGLVQISLFLGIGDLEKNTRMWRAVGGQLSREERTFPILNRFCYI